MTTRPTIFLSSTAEDLADYRERARHVAQRLGMAVTAMEEFGPDPGSAVEVCERRVRAATLFVGLYAHRYGFRPEGRGGKSITHLEYDWAIDEGIPVLLFIVDDAYPWSPVSIDRGESADALAAFKRHVRATHVIAPLTTPDRLRDDLFVHLPAFARPEVADVPTIQEERRRVAPPTPYVAHPYTLLETSQMIGREHELALLQEWARTGRHGDRVAPLLCLVAIGGMGKSALTWKWFQPGPAGTARGCRTHVVELL